MNRQTRLSDDSQSMVVDCKRLPRLFGDEQKLISALALHFDEVLHSRMIDLRQIACVIFQEDCKVRRSDHWRRKMLIEVSVREPDFWKNDSVYVALQEALSLTGDDWSFDFVASNRPLPATQLRLAMGEQPMGARIFLATEGSDSVCGINLQLKSDKNAQFLGVNGVSQPSRASRLNDILSMMSQEATNRLSLVQVPLQRTQPSVRSAEEPSQRSRSFLLLIMGSIFACLTGSSVVEIYENGIEAFNFPLQPSAEPARFSRAMNPLLVSKVQALISLVADNQVTFFMPYLFHTKAQIITEALPILSQTQMKQTISCMRYSSRRAGIAHCGLCAGCILRRISFASANIDDKTIVNYRADIYSEEDNRVERWADLDRLYVQMDYLNSNVVQQRYEDDALAGLLNLSGLPWQEREKLIEAAAMLNKISILEARCKLLDLYRKFAAEWAAIAPNILALPVYKHTLIAKLDDKLTILGGSKGA